VLLRQVARPDRLDVVVIEDVHWADGATLDLVRFLGRRLRDAHVLFPRHGTGTTRWPPTIPCGSRSATWRSQRSTRRIGLAPLSSRAVGRSGRGTRLAGEELFRLTGGNPFYVTEILRPGPRRSRCRRATRCWRGRQGSARVPVTCSMSRR
jgi:predicted ATPase